MKVSIVTVCLNSERYIEQTIKSVLGQTYKDIEYIIVDGMSSDSTLNIIEKYRPLFGERLKVISEKDKGIYDAMNKGINNATGELIGIINSDDWYELDAVENVVKAYINNKNSVIYGCMTVRVEDEISKISISDYKNLKETMIDHPTVFVPKSIYQKFGLFNTDYKIIADYEFILRIYNENIPFQYIPRVIANFREGGVSTTFDELCKNEIENLKRKYGYEIKPYNIDPRFNKIIKFFWDHLIYKLNEYKDKKIYIYGSGNHTKKLLEYICTNPNINIEGIIDENVSQNNMEILGFPISCLDEISYDADLIIISSLTYEYKIYKRIEFLGDRVDILRIYGEDSVSKINEFIRNFYMI